jgi:hypothetical protein
VASCEFSPACSSVASPELSETPAPGKVPACTEILSDNLRICWSGIRAFIKWVHYIAIADYILVIEDHVPCTLEVIQAIFDDLLNVSDICDQSPCIQLWFEFC